MIPCFLLELGRRRRHIEIEFPVDFSASAARFGLRTGPSYPTYCISSEQLVRVVAATGEELVGLSYFGDQQSREHVEAQLALQGRDAGFQDSAVRFVISFQTEALEPTPRMTQRGSSADSRLSYVLLRSSRHRERRNLAVFRSSIRDTLAVRSSRE